MFTQISNETNMIIGDFNTKVGPERTEGVTEGFELGKRHELTHTVLPRGEYGN